MACLVLVTTMSFTIDMHFCGDRLVDVSVFKEAKDCGMAMERPASGCETTLQNKSCCSDLNYLVEGQTDVTPTFDTFNVEQQLIFTSYFYSYAALFKSVENNNISYKPYSPPYLIRDIQAFHQTFLI